MSDVAIIDQKQPQAPAKASRITPRLKRALHLMVWDAKTDNEAAVETGMTISAIRIALREPAVRAYYREQLQVLRERESSRNIHTLIDVRDQKTNQMARVQAVKALEQISDEQASVPGASHSSGVTIRIINQAPADQRPIIDVTPSADISSAERD